MSLASHSLFLNSPTRLTLCITASKTPNLFSGPSHFPIPNPTPNLTNPKPYLLAARHVTRLGAAAYDSSSVDLRPPPSDDFNLDYFLSIAEFLCLASSASVSIGFGMRMEAVLAAGNRVLGGGALALVAAVGIGAWIRRRQWRRVCRETVRGGVEVNLFERIEKLEEDLRSSATLVRVLSRQLEKLGIRFRVTRKALKEPIAETAALAQKNSEATRALAAQEDILEKELGETQKVLLAMQEQQQKQLELILAIAKNGKLLDNKQAHDQPESAIRKRDSSTDTSKQREAHQI